MTYGPTVVSVFSLMDLIVPTDGSTAQTPYVLKRRVMLAVSLDTGCSLLVRCVLAGEDGDKGFSKFDFHSPNLDGPLDERLVVKDK